MARKILKVALVVTSLWGLIMWNPGTSLAERGAKDIFNEGFEEDITKISANVEPPPKETKPSEEQTPVKSAIKRPSKQRVTVASTHASKPANKGVKYWIELMGTDQMREQIVGDSKRVFRTGERIRFHFQMNTDGYLYIWQKGAKGNTSVLFPDVRVKGGDNYVHKGVEYVVPEGMWFKFNQPRGQLEFLVFLSRNKLNMTSEGTFHQRETFPQRNPDVHAIQKGKKRLEASVGQKEQNKPDIGKLMSNNIVLAMAQEQVGSKDLRLETVDADSDPASYIVTVSQDPEWTVSFQIILNQQ